MLLRRLYKTKIFWKYTNEFTSNCLGLAYKKDYGEQSNTGIYVYKYTLTESAFIED